MKKITPICFTIVVMVIAIEPLYLKGISFRFSPDWQLPSLIAATAAVLCWGIYLLTIMDTMEDDEDKHKLSGLMIYNLLFCPAMILNLVHVWFDLEMPNWALCVILAFILGIVWTGAVRIIVMEKPSTLPPPYTG